MENIYKILNKKLENILHQLNYADISIVVRNSRYRQFQVDSLISYAHKTNQNPMILSESLKTQMIYDDFFENVLVTPPGFINFDISRKSYSQLFSENEITVSLPQKKGKVIFDYGGPNIAKQLHIGHLRCAYLGQSLYNLTREYGISCISDIHLGDHGYNMGLVLAESEAENIDLLRVKDSFNNNYFSIFRMYLSANKRSIDNIKFRERANEISAEIFSNEYYLKRWNVLKDISKQYLKYLYDSINVTFDYWKGESDSLIYMDKVIKRVKKFCDTKVEDKTLFVKVSDSQKSLENYVPIRKKNGVYLYLATELATLYERVEKNLPTEIYYIVDYRQKSHFENLFYLSNITKITTDNIFQQHIIYGTVTDKNKPIKSRENTYWQVTRLLSDLKNDFNLKYLKANCSLNPQKMDEYMHINIKWRILQISRNRNISLAYEDFLLEKGNCGIYILNTFYTVSSIANETTLKVQYNFRDCDKQKIEIAKNILDFVQVLEYTYYAKSFHIFCQYIYKLCKYFNMYLHSCKSNLEDEFLLFFSTYLKFILKYSFNILSIKF